MTIEEILALVERDAASHTLAGASSEEEIRSLEKRLGGSLPAPFRAFLLRFGGGILYQRHEIFGSRRVMLHDIEFVPDMVTMSRRLGREAPETRLVPLHRAASNLHHLNLAPGPDHGRIVSADDGHSYPDFVVFLEQVVLPGGSG